MSDRSAARVQTTMALHLHHDPRAEALIDVLAGLLRDPTDDPYATDTVVVHGAGLERWIAQELASRLGVCANVVFPLPDGFLASIDPAGEARWTRRRMADVLLGLLPGAPEPVASWLAARGGDDAERVALANVAAEQLDRMAAFRPDVVAGWVDGGGGWQGHLWRGLRDRLGADPSSRLVDGDVGAGRLAVFGVGSLPPLAVRALGAVAARRDVHVLLLDPCPGGWDVLSRRLAGIGPAHPRRRDVDLEPAHPLLASCGTQIRELAASFLLLDPPPVVYAPVGVVSSDDTVLRALQLDLARDRVTPRSDPDRTVRVHGCVGAARQVEVLRDQLLGLLDADPTLQPRDIVVLAPDLSAWAPLLTATFHADAGGHALRVSLADLPETRDNDVADGLLRVLRLAGGRWLVSDVVCAVSAPALLAGAGLSPADVPRLRALVDLAQIRWGRDADHRAAYGLPADERYTWREGLDRLHLGAAVARVDVVAGLAPADADGDHDAAWITLLETLLDLTAGFGVRRAPASWRDALLPLVGHLFPGSDDELRAGRHRVERRLGELASLEVDALDLSGVTAWLAGQLGRTEPGRRFLAGDVTCAQLVPMRSIPFRVVALLGMDDGAFPRLPTAMADDGMAAEPRLGDRSARDDDRALFLEAVSSARDHLLVFFTAVDPSDGRARTPCAPVAELLDLLAETWPDAPGDTFLVRHPLTSWGASREGTWDPRASVRAAARARAPTEPEPFLPGPLPAIPRPAELALDALGQFLKAPVKRLLATRLRVTFRDAPEAGPDREPVQIGGLESWALAEDVLSRRLAGEPLGERDEGWLALVARHPLPLGMPGRAALRRWVATVDELLDRAADLLVEPERREALEIVVGGTVVHGEVPIRGDQVVWVTTTKGSPHRQLRAWLDHLAANVALGPTRTVLAAVDGPTAWRPLDPAVAGALLADLVEVYVLGSRWPLAFSPEASLDYASTGTATWSSADPAVRLVFGDSDPFEGPPDGVATPPDDDARSLARRVWGPALEHQETR